MLHLPFGRAGAPGHIHKKNTNKQTNKQYGSNNVKKQLERKLFTLKKKSNFISLFRLKLIVQYDFKQYKYAVIFVYAK